MTRYTLMGELYEDSQEREESVKKVNKYFEDLDSVIEQTEFLPSLNWDKIAMDIFLSKPIKSNWRYGDANSIEELIEGDLLLFGRDFIGQYLLELKATSPDKQLPEFENTGWVCQNKVENHVCITGAYVINGKKMRVTLSGYNTPPIQNPKQSKESKTQQEEPPANKDLESNIEQDTSQINEPEILVTTDPHFRELYTAGGAYNWMLTAGLAAGGFVTYLGGLNTDSYSKMVEFYLVLTSSLTVLYGGGGMLLMAIDTTESKQLLPETKKVE